MCYAEGANIDDSFEGFTALSSYSSDTAFLLPDPLRKDKRTGGWAEIGRRQMSEEVSGCPEWGRGGAGTFEKPIKKRGKILFNLILK